MSAEYEFSLLDIDFQAPWRVTDSIIILILGNLRQVDSKSFLKENDQWLRQIQFLSTNQ